MPTPIKFRVKFTPENFYHIVFKCVGGNLLFKEEADYYQFKVRFKKYTAGVFECWGYSLLSNHVHLIVRTANHPALTSFISLLPPDKRSVSMKKFLVLPDEKTFSEITERQINSLLISYVIYFNKKYDRQGSLFQKPFKRILIDNESYLQQAVIYCNANAEHHQLTKDFKLYPYCSYISVIKGDYDIVTTDAVVNFFGGLQKFIAAHEKQVEYYYKNSWPLSKLE